MVDEHDTASLDELEGEEESEDDEQEQLDFSPFEEIDEEYQPQSIFKVIGPDGLPQQVSPDSGKSDIPSLSPETMKCMGDFSVFYELPDTKSKPHSIEEVLRVSVDAWVLRSNEKVHVYPERLPCVHYVRQMLQSDLNPEIRMISRLCGARRDRNGAFMSVRDRAVYACDMRDPPDLHSIQLLDEFDESKVQQGKHRVFLPMFKKEK